jgi:histidine triad (HIT) family protein
MSLDCVFCKIAAGELDSEIFYIDQEIVVLKDANPHAPTHLLILPVKHYADLAEAAEKSPQLLTTLLAKCADLGQKIGGSRGFRVVINTGPDGGQTVNHLHFHLLAGRELQWPPG